MKETNPPLSCGKCGYAVRGISELKCPECGADLTVVGITPGGKTRSTVIGISITLGYTAAAVACALIVLRLVQPLLPIYVDRYYSIQIEPASGEYDEVGLHLNAHLVQPASQSSSTNVTVSPNSGPITTVTMCDPGSKIDVYDIDVFLKFNAFNNQLGSTEVALNIDPTTRQLTWHETPTVWHETPAAFTDQDLLTAFTAYGFDTSRPDVQLEARQIHAFITDFIQGNHQLTLSAFTSRAYGGGSNTEHGPPWFLPTYVVVWVVLWLIGLVLLIRRGRAKTPR